MVLVSVENKGAYCCLISYSSLESWTLKIHLQLICSSHTITMFADPTLKT